MTQVYKLVVANGQSTGWLALSQQERDALWAKADKMFNEVGGQRVMNCDSSWSSEEHPAFFIEIFPSVEALQKYTQFLNEIQMLRHFNTLTIVGTPVPNG